MQQRVPFYLPANTAVGTCAKGLAWIESDALYLLFSSSSSVPTETEIVIPYSHIADIQFTSRLFSAELQVQFRANTPPVLPGTSDTVISLRFCHRNAADAARILNAPLRLEFPEESQYTAQKE